jgi:hypothetical protein
MSLNDIPVLRPVIGLLFSRKGLTYIISLIVGGIIMLRPDIDNESQSILFQALYVVLAFVGNMVLQVTVAWEDNAERAKEAVENQLPAEDALRDLLKDLIDDIILPNREGESPV